MRLIWNKNKKMKPFLNHLLFVLLAMLFASCQKDNIVSVAMIATSDDVNDDIAGTTFAQTIYVAFQDNGSAIVTGATDDFSVTINGNDVTIVYAGEEHVMYELYDETTMPNELRKAHKANDDAVMAAYGFNLTLSKNEIVAELFKMYQELVKQQ